MDWSLLSCGRHGHVTYAPDEPELAEQMSGQLAAQEAWQCLRCAAFVPGPPQARGPAARAPVVARGVQIRSRLILRLFAVERAIRVVLFGTASIFLWHFRHSQQDLLRAFNRELPVLRSSFRQLGYNVDKSGLVGLLRHALSLSSHTLTLLAIGAGLYALIELVEAVGLWTARRWGEYFAMVATSLGLPLEIYDLSRGVTVTALVLLGINILLVVYLAVTKRLFGIRGGKRAYDARLREESVLEAAADAATNNSKAPTLSIDEQHGGRDVAEPGGATADGPPLDASPPGGVRADGGRGDGGRGDGGRAEPGEPADAADRRGAGR
jgi:uncharacterized membrane protein (DUF2068 family)